MTLAQRKAKKALLSQRIEKLRREFRAVNSKRRIAYIAMRDQALHNMAGLAKDIRNLGVTCRHTKEGDVVRMVECARYYSKCLYGLVTYHPPNMWCQEIPTSKSGKIRHILPLRQDGRVGTNGRRYRCKNWEILEVLPESHPLVKRAKRRQLVARLEGKEWPW